MDNKIDNHLQNADFKLISVESRKGGVGKTTAALNLADLLLEKGFRVLLLDLDITGTSISGSFKNSYWEEKINPIKDHKDNKKDLNLLNLFNNHFLTGEPWPGFSNAYRIDDSKINIISSDIYADDGRLICDPRIIFDELHSFWIIEMLEHICKSFIEECLNNNGSCKTAIILDNSPGYVGLGKAVHEWLADIGPENGKFITVSSLDVQDINSCMSSIIAIDSLIDYRVEAAKRYYALKQGNANKLEISELTENSKAFFNNLVTNNLNNKYSYYRNWSTFSKKPDKTYYQSFIINKVPPEIRSRTFKYNAEKVFSDSEDSKRIFYEYTGLQDGLEPKNCVYYDEFIHFQFVEPYIFKVKAKTKQLSHLKGYFTRIYTIIKNYSDTTKQENNSSDILNCINEYEKRLTYLLDKLRNANFENIVRIVDDRWHPIAPLNKLLKSINDFDAKDLEEGISFPDFIYKVSSILQHTRLENKYFDYKNIGTISIFIDNIEQATNTIKQFLSSEYYYQDVVENFVRIMTTLQHLLLAVSNKPFKQISNSLSDKHIVTLLDYNINYSQKLAELYKIFIEAQSRIVNVNEDFSFLIDVLKRVTIEAEDSDSDIFPNIRDILDDVIVNRNVSHKESMIGLSKALKRAKYMSDFRKVLEENVINQWHL